MTYSMPVEPEGRDWVYRGTSSVRTPPRRTLQ